MTRRPGGFGTSRGWWPWVGAGVLAFLLPVVVRVAVEGRRELIRAEQAAARGDVSARLDALARAARWTLPAGLGTQGEALEALEALAHEPGQDPGVARAAHRQVRRALLGTRAWGVRDTAALEHANAWLDGITPSTGAQGSAYRTPEPTQWRANLAALAFVVWVGATLGFVRRGLDAKLRLRPAAAVRWGFVWIVGLLTWVTLTRLSG